MAVQMLSERTELALALLASVARHRTASIARSPIVDRAPAHLPALQRAKIDSLYYRLRDERAAAQRVYARIWRTQRDAAVQVVGEIERRGVACLVLKGAEIIEADLGGVPVGAMNDVDLLVPRGSLGLAKRTLFELGFVQGEIDPARLELRDADLFEVARLESSHYELFPFMRLVTIPVDDEEAAFVAATDKRVAWMKDGACQVLVEIDVHFKVASDIDAEPLFDASVPSALGCGRTPCTADHLWLTTSRYYHEVALHAKDTLRDFALIIALLDRPAIDWGRIIEFAERYDLRPSLHYYLGVADRIRGGGSIPEDVRAALAPERGARIRDWGWQLGRLLGIADVCPLSERGGER